MNGQSIQNPFASAFQASSAALALMLVASLCFFFPPVIVLVPLAGATFLWVIFRHPMGILGVVLAFMPIDYLAIELGKFFRVPGMMLISACTKEIPLCLLTFVLWRRNRFKPLMPDWFLLAFCAIAALYTVFQGSWAALAIDLNFAIPYFVGRMTVLKKEQEQKWATTAVWIVACLSVLGLSEVFIFGEGPRTVLYVATGAMTDSGGLTASFHAMGFNGLREASTMVGPPSFGPLCMIGLVLWWVYRRNPLPAAMTAVGLICSVTRSAWLGTAIAIPLLGLMMDQRRRLFRYAGLALALSVASIPILGLGDFLFANKTGEDLSAESHQDQIVNGLKYVSEHPFGSGNTKTSRLALLEDANATAFETTYPSVAAEYGIPAMLCFVGFLLSALMLVWHTKSNLSYAAVGILVGIAVVMAVTVPLDDRRLACWAFFPVGLAVRAGAEWKGRQS